MTEATRAWLRALPSFPDELPSFDVENAPTDPAELFLRWMREAVGAGVLAPHAGTLSTSDADGVVTARVLVLKDVDAGAWRVATSLVGAAGVSARQNPNAALTFFWPGLGRQVKVSGRISSESREAAVADYRRRPGVADDLDPDLVPADWAVWALSPSAVEFWQAAHSREHLRLGYRLGADGWTHEVVTP